ncbi:hypothetical protein [Desulfogranum japonicum]|uniref:hypothetical protein n=1 Tax=Desulfogranum japonicum TaxID=231447 RepID=UPI000426F773|nr:hypothetical protein [Desulfogranum japonicum]
MVWQYRTIVFEFAKDGLLGDRYIDDEEMETTLNEQGKFGWELVDVVMVQEGVLAVLKRPQETGLESAASGIEETPLTQAPLLSGAGSQETVYSIQDLQQQEAQHIRELEQQRKHSMEQHERDMIGEIKIS